MAASDSHGVASFSGAASFYKVMFFLSLIVLVFLPLGALGLRGCLGLGASRLEGEKSALEAEVAALTGDIAADSSEIEALVAEEAALAGAEQVFAEDANEPNLWGTDVRWSEMGKLRVQAIWAAKGAIRASMVETQALKRERIADIARIETQLEQNATIRAFIEDRRLVLYIGLLGGSFLTIVFALLWAALVQSRINRVLQKMAG
ncbi:MAG: hypothetical protein ACYTAS_04815 [Planctomycetota bacterium]